MRKQYIYLILRINDSDLVLLIISAKETAYSSPYNDLYSLMKLLYVLFDKLCEPSLRRASGICVNIVMWA